MSHFIIYTRDTTPGNLADILDGKEHASGFIQNLMGGCRRWLKSLQLPETF